MKACGFSFQRVSLVFIFSSLLFVTDLSAQKGEPGIKAEPGVQQAPSFTCGVCPSGFTPLTGAGWTLCWAQQVAQGLVIRNACFKAQQVLFQMTQPFVLVPYHGGGPTFKDGLGVQPRCRGVPYVQIRPSGTGADLVNSTLDDENPGYPPAAGYDGAGDYYKVEVAATYEAAFYRYRQRYIFHGTGDVDALFGFGGFLNPSIPHVAHFHSPYWRLDFDLDDFTENFVEEFSHPTLEMPDVLTRLDKEGKRSGHPSSFTKWRVRSNTRNAQGQFHSWDIEAIVGTTYEKGTAVFWPVVFHSGEEGEVVGEADCSDAELETKYSNPAESINPNDVAVWVATHRHHELRAPSEEHRRIPGFEWTGIHLSPRNFLNSTPEPEP